MTEKIDIDRDNHSGGVITKDATALKEYKAKKNLLRQKDKKISQLEDRVLFIETLLRKHGLFETK